MGEFWGNFCVNIEKLPGLVKGINSCADQVIGEEILGLESMKAGDRVRVKTSIIVYIHPEHRNQPFDIKGLEGEIVLIDKDWNGRPISPNLPIVVKFSKKFKAHFKSEELEVISV